MGVARGVTVGGARQCAMGQGGVKSYMLEYNGPGRGGAGRGGGRAACEEGGAGAREQRDGVVR